MLTSLVLVEVFVVFLGRRVGDAGWEVVAGDGVLAGAALAREEGVEARVVVDYRVDLV